MEQDLVHGAHAGVEGAMAETGCAGEIGEMQLRIDGMNIPVYEWEAVQLQRLWHLRGVMTSEELNLQIQS